MIVASLSYSDYNDPSKVLLTVLSHLTATLDVERPPLHCLLLTGRNKQTIECSNYVEPRGGQCLENIFVTRGLISHFCHPEIVWILKSKSPSVLQYMSGINLLIIKVTISSLVIGLKMFYFPLIRLPSCYRTVCYRAV